MSGLCPQSRVFVIFRVVRAISLLLRRQPPSYSRAEPRYYTVADFVAELRHLAQHCEFRTSLEDMLRDRLVCGIKDSRVQRRLITEAKLTFNKALEMVQAAEAADQGTKMLQSGSAPNSTVLAVEKLQVPVRNFNKEKCFRCGRRHPSHTCRCKDWLCNNCGKRGHVAKVCRSARTNPINQEQDNPRKRRRVLQFADAEIDGENPTPEEVHTLFYAGQSPFPPFFVNVTINTVEVNMLVNTGASVSILSMKWFKSLWTGAHRLAIKPSGVNLHTYSGERLRVVGEASVQVTYRGQKHSLTITIVEGSGPPLLGRDWVCKLGVKLVEPQDQATVLHTESTGSLKDILSKYSELFQDTLGLVKGLKVKLQVNPGSQPRFYKPRSVPFALREKIEAELEGLCKEKVIEPVQFSEWATPIVPVVKGDGSIRICGDYKITVNRAASVESYPIPCIEDLLASIGNARSSLSWTSLMPTSS